MICSKNIFLKLIICSVILLNGRLINAQCNLLCNTDFENNQVTTPGNYTIVDASQVPCWGTTASDNNIEVWGSGFIGVPSYSGNQFIELNAYMVSTLFQNFTVAPGTSLTVSFAHRGRAGIDVLSVDIGPVGGSYTTLGTYSDDNTSWGYYTVNYTVPTGLGSTYSLRFNSVSAAGGNPAVGNFLDAISVNLPSPNLTTTITNASCGIANGTATVTASGGTPPYSYLWSTNPVQTTQTATGLGAGSYTVTVSDSNGCASSDTTTLAMNSAPLVNVRAAANPLCDSTKLNWASWSSVNSTTGTGIISSDLNVTVTKPTGGLSTTGGMFNGGVFPPQYNVPVNNTAIRNDLAGLFTFCYNQPVVNPQIALSSIGNGGNSVQINTSVPYAVIWLGQGMSYPNDTTFVGTEGYTIIQFPGIHTCISFDYLQSETYCNLAFGSLDTNCQALAPPPKCAGGSDTLTASGALTYSWSPAAGLDTTSGAVVVATPTVTTTYYVTGYDANNCSDTDSITIVINSMPVVSVSGDTVLCSGDSTSLTVSGGTSYLWKPLNLTDSIVTLNPLNTVTYTVVATNTAGCEDSTNVNIIVNPLPQAQFNLLPVCKNEPTAFNDLSTGNISTWTWDYGDGATSVLPNSIHTYATCDSFDVKLNVTTFDGCIDSAINTAVVYCLPVADYNVNDECMNQVANFTDVSTVSGETITTWSWNFADNSILGTSQNPSHTYTTSGSYPVSLITTTNQGCKDTVVKSITIHPLPVSLFSANNSCAGSIVSFTNQSIIPAPDSIQSWVWDFADGSPVYNNPTILHSYPTAGYYTVKLTMLSDFGCADSLTKTIIINPNPIVDFIATDTVGCSPLFLSFQDMSYIPAPAGNVQWTWDMGDSSGIYSSQSFDHTYTNISNITSVYFSVTLTVTSDSGCVTTQTKNNYITVYPNPQALFSVDPSVTDITNPNTTIVNQSTGGSIYSWNFGDNSAPLTTGTDTSFNPNPLVHTYTDTGSYAITLTITNQYGCMDTAYQNVIVEPNFIFYIPSAFSPNGDGINDSFSGKGDFIKEYTMSVFDRWGNLIYRTDELDKPWDGKANYGSELAQQDTYIYSIIITDFKKQKHRYKGIVTLLAGELKD